MAYVRYLRAPSGTEVEKKYREELEKFKTANVFVVVFFLLLVLDVYVLSRLMDSWGAILLLGLGVTAFLTPIATAAVTFVPMVLLSRSTDSLFSRSRGYWIATP